MTCLCCTDFYFSDFSFQHHAFPPKSCPFFIDFVKPAAVVPNGFLQPPNSFARDLACSLSCGFCGLGSFFHHLRPTPFVDGLIGPSNPWYPQIPIRSSYQVDGVHAAPCFPSGFVANSWQNASLWRILIFDS